MVMTIAKPMGRWISSNSGHPCRQSRFEFLLYERTSTYFEGQCARLGDKGAKSKKLYTFYRTRIFLRISFGG